MTEDEYIANLRLKFESMLEGAKISGRLGELSRVLGEHAEREVENLPSLARCRESEGQLMPEKRRCVHCFHEGLDVHEWRHYIGGVGDRFLMECDSQPECTKRQDLLLFSRTLGELLQAGRQEAVRA